MNVDTKAGRAASATEVWALVALLAGAGTFACGDEDGGEPKPCNPMAAAETPITLGTVLAAGKHADGTIYVVDRSSDRTAEYRVFVSQQGVLARRQVAGSGVSSDSGRQFYTFTIQGESPFMLKVETEEGSGRTRMGVLRGETTARTFDIGVEGDVLEVVPPESIKGMPLKNLGGVFVEYVAELPDRRKLVVVRPEVDWQYDDFRVFFGPSDRIEERAVNSVVRQRDGGTTTIRFRVDGAEAAALFPASATTMPELTLGGEKLPLTRLPRDAASATGFSYFCSSG